jgi:hypothetical protein
MRRRAATLAHYFVADAWSRLQHRDWHYVNTIRAAHGHAGAGDDGKAARRLCAPFHNFAPKPEERAPSSIALPLSLISKAPQLPSRSSIMASTSSMLRKNQVFY